MRAESESLTASRPRSRRCRRGKHKMRHESYVRNLTSHSIKESHTYRENLVCARGCGHEEVWERFDSRGYWAAVDRNYEDERLKRIIREATR